MSAEVRLGDWRDVLPGTYDPAHAVVVTDPPYGLVASGMTVAAREDRLAVDKGYEDTIPWAQHVTDVLELLPAKRHVIRGPATRLMDRDYPQPRRLCVEMAQYRRRSVHRPGVVPHLWQGWAIYGRLKLERHANPPKGDALSGGMLLQRHEGDLHATRTAHRGLTPFSSASWIIDTWVDPGDVVIDPFAGLGTIGRAARMHGFDYIGAEIVPEYADVATDSFTREALTMGLVG